MSLNFLKNTLNISDNDILETKKYSGHKKQYGKDANIKKNQYVKFKTNNDYYYVINTQNNYFVINQESKNKIISYEKTHNIKLTFYQMTNGYIACHHNNKNLYLHQIIMDYYGNGKGTKNGSIDHIDRNPLNNVFTNLRIVDDKIQQENKIGIIEGTKRKRNHNAQPLPTGITQDMLPKNVYYASDKQTDKLREWFVFSYGKNNERIYSSKSTEVTIFQKLNEIKNYVNMFKNGITDFKIKKYPKYVSLSKDGKLFRYDNRNLKLNLKHTLTTPLDIEEPNLITKSNELKLLQKKLIDKYPTNEFDFSEFFIDNNEPQITNTKFNDKYQLELPMYYNIRPINNKDSFIFSKGHGKNEIRQEKIKQINPTENIKNQFENFIKEVNETFNKPKKNLPSKNLDTKFKLPRCFSIITENNLEYICYQKTINKKNIVRKYRYKNDLEYDFNEFKKQLIEEFPNIDKKTKQELIMEELGCDFELPKYYRIIKSNNKFTFRYDRKLSNDSRQTKTETINTEKDIEKQFIDFKNDVNKKYNILDL